MSILEVLRTYDWREAFCDKLAPEDKEDWSGGPHGEGYNEPNPAIPNAQISLEKFSRDDVKEIHGIEEGENDGPSWIIYGLLKDDRHFYLEAGCDYTGWD